MSAGKARRRRMFVVAGATVVSGRLSRTARARPRQHSWLADADRLAAAQPPSSVTEGGGGRGGGQKNVETFSKMLMKTNVGSNIFVNTKFWCNFSKKMLDQLFMKNVGSTFFLKNVVKMLQHFLFNNYEVG
jgi:hypothetical protein